MLYASSDNATKNVTILGANLVIQLVQFFFITVMLYVSSDKATKNATIHGTNLVIQLAWFFFTEKSRQFYD